MSRGTILRRRLRSGARVGLERLGLERRSDRLVDLEPEFRGLYERCSPYSMTTPERLYAVYQATRYIVAAGVGGAYVECGVWRGGSSMMAALTLSRLGDRERELFLYDTYEGMTEPRVEDTAPSAYPTDPHVEWERHREEDRNTWCYSPIEEVRANMASTGFPAERMTFVEGDVAETIPRLVPDRISLLRLDTDWYASTRHELVHLFPLLEPRGVLILDDYGHWPGARRAVDEYFDENGVSMLLNRIDYSGRIGVKLP